MLFIIRLLYGSDSDRLTPIPLPATLRSRLEAAGLRHDSSVNSGGCLRAGFDEVVDVGQAPDTSHPAVPKHPGSGRPVLHQGGCLRGRLTSGERRGPDAAASDAAQPPERR